MSEDRFGKMALELGLVSEAQLADSIEAMKQLADMGLTERLGTIMVKKGYLTSEQVKQVLAAQGSTTRTQIAGYEIIEKIGQGAMGAVYKALQTSMDRTVALKVLPPSLARDKRFIDRFLTEARAAARLNHPNIIQGIDVGQANKYYYFAMEYVDGTTVGERLRKSGPMNEEETVSVAAQVADALSYAARHNIVHRDIKPDNIMIASDGTAKLCDLGLAKRGKYRDPAAEGTSIGTPHYISPEQAKGLAEVDVRSDIYSLGATMYHMVTGHPPFEGSTAAVVMTKHLTEEVASPQDVREELSDGFAHVIEKMMAKDPADRYQTPGALLDDLRRVADGGAPRSERVRVGGSSVMRAARRRVSGRKAAEAAGTSMTPYIAGAAGMVMVLGFVAVLLWPSQQPDPAPMHPEPPTPPGPPPVVSNPAVVTPARPPEENEKDAAEEMFNAARDYAKKDPEQFWDIFRKFGMVKSGAAGTKYSLMADDELKGHRTRQERLRRERFDEYKRKAAALETEDRFADAKKIFEDFPQQLLEDDTPRAFFFLEREKQRIEIASRARHAELVKSIKEKLSAGELAEAKTLIARAGRIGIEKLAAELPALAKQLADAEKAAADAARAEAERRLEADFRSERSRIIGLGRARSFREARAAALAALADKRMAPWKGELGRIERAMGIMAARMTSLAEVLASRAVDGKPVTIHKRGVLYRGAKVVSIEGDTATIELRGMGKTALKMGELSARDVVDLTGLGVYSQDAKFEYGLLLFFEGREPQSKTQLERASEHGARADDAKYFLGLIEAGSKTAREAEAAQLLAQARGHFAAERWAQAKKLLDQLMRDYSDTDVYRTNLKRLGSPKKGAGAK